MKGFRGCSWVFDNGGERLPIMAGTPPRCGERGCRGQAPAQRRVSSCYRSLSGAPLPRGTAPHKAAPTLAPTPPAPGRTHHRSSFYFYCRGPTLLFHTLVLALLKLPLILLAFRSPCPPPHTDACSILLSYHVTAARISLVLCG